MEDKDKIAILYSVEKDGNRYLIPDNFDRLDECKKLVVFGNCDERDKIYISNLLKNRIGYYKSKIIFKLSAVSSFVYVSLPYIFSTIFYAPFKYTIEFDLNRQLTFSSLTDLLNYLTLYGLKEFGLSTFIPQPLIAFWSFSSLVSPLLICGYLWYRWSKSDLKRANVLKKFLKALKKEIIVKKEIPKENRNLRNFLWYMKEKNFDYLKFIENEGSI
ncbi:MAG: hypothetical protein QXJ14_00525 [Candidatus Aenigmatarchaeota archaeon]